MLITDEIFQAFLKCETKSYFKSSGVVGGQQEFSNWEQKLFEDFKRVCCTKLRSALQEDECLVNTSLPQALKDNKVSLFIDCTVQAQGIKSQLHALERSIPRDKTRKSSYIPIRFVPREKITKHDRLLLAFDALALFNASGKMPLFGKIIHSRALATVKVKLDALVKFVRTVITKIEAQQSGVTTPQLILNKHCSECEFQLRCRQSATEKAELSLLSGMTKKERERQHSKGIFSITQLSYTFRPRRRSKRLSSKPDKYSHAVKALAIRENKIHIVGRPELKTNGTLICFDIEGIPDQGFYYLIGLRIGSGDSYVQHSFWADDLSEEKGIWARFIKTLAEIENPQLIHYGSYETVFLKRMKARYPETISDPAFLDRLLAESVNILSVIYAKFYFPTYSNGLKDIAQHLGFQWSEGSASGLKALLWRSQWESSRDSLLKQKIVTYNAEDCEALEKVVITLAQLCQRHTGTAIQGNSDIVHTDTLKREYPQRFGKVDYTMPELEFINQSAYWNYQRDRVYVRTHPQLKRSCRKKIKHRIKAISINKSVQCELPRPTYCPKCKSRTIYKYGRMSKIVQDLKFGRTAIKRWVVKYDFDRFICWECKATFYSEDRPWTRSRYGSGLRSYMIYLTIELKLTQRSVTQSLNQLFGFDLSTNAIPNQKRISSGLYKDTYDGIFKKIISGSLIHADETRIDLIGKSAFVWVFTNLEEVVYYYKETREGDFLQTLLQEFNGVLVSDFYAAYDSINCPQQKCLIHLIRDLNEDLLKQPFNEELKELVQEFARLLKPMIETVDRFGLKARFLRKHKVFVERFYKVLSKREYKSEAAVKNRKRFERNREKLFTFLDYDGVPWNNNNAEHAIKSFARLRNVIGGSSTEKGIREYLILLSICETCKYRGINFLDFLRSGEKDIDSFLR